jgi:hypothetical protein
MLSCVLLTATVSHAATPVKRSAIPKAFHGDWSVEAGNCASGPSVIGNVRITARTILKFEMVGTIKRVTIVDPQTIYVRSRVIHDNKAYNAVHNFINYEPLLLSADKQQLTIGEGEVMVVYTRCGK